MTDEDESHDNLHTTLAEQHKAELEKSQQVHAQKALYDSLLKIRISLQHSHALVNRLPQHDTHAAFSAFTPENNSKFERCIHSTQLLLDDLCALQQHVISMAPGLRQPESTGQLLDDPVDDIWQNRIEGTYSTNRNNVLQILDKWNRKTRLASGGSITQGKQFKAINLDLATQIEQYLSDQTTQQRLVSRTRPKRSQIQVIGQSVTAKKMRLSTTETQLSNKTETDTAEYDEEIFDDADLLRTFLQEHASEVGSEHNETDIAMAPRAPPRNPKPMKTKEDRLKTKGRQIRYIVHDKLVNFMVPEDTPTKRELPILTRLFGKPVKVAGTSESLATKTTS